LSVADAASASNAAGGFGMPQPIIANPSKNAAQAQWNTFGLDQRPVDVPVPLAPTAPNFPEFDQPTKMRPHPLDPDDGHRLDGPAKSPPYDEWFANGNTTLNVSMTAMDTGDDYDQILFLLDESGFALEGEVQRNGPTVFSKKMLGPNGLHEVRITLHSADYHNIFDDMNDPNVHMIAYMGHSEMGQMAREHLRKNVEQVGKKLLYFGMCTGVHTMQDVRAHYHDAHVVTTLGPGWVFSMEYPDRIEEAEGFRGLMVTISAAVNREKYGKIHHRLKTEAMLHRYHDAIPLTDNNNFVTTSMDWVMSRVTDHDGDGIVDIIDTNSNDVTYEIPTDPAQEFRAINTLAAEHLYGGKVLAAVNALATSSWYNPMTESYSHTQVLAGGYFDPDPGERVIVKFERVETDHGPNYIMRVNAHYAHMSMELLNAITHFEFIMTINKHHMNDKEFVDSLRPSLAHLDPRGAEFGKAQLLDACDALDKTEHKLMALLFAASVLTYDRSLVGRQTEVWRKLLAVYGFPMDMPFWRVRRILEQEHHAYTGRPGLVKTWKETLPRAVLRKLRSSKVGRPVRKLKLPDNSRSWMFG